MGPSLVPPCAHMRNSVEDLLVYLGFCLFLVERFYETLGLYHAVREPLVPAWGEKCVVNAISVVRKPGGAGICTKGGRATRQKRQESRVFDCTKGFQGDDPRVRLDQN